VQFLLREPLGLPRAGGLPAIFEGCPLCVEAAAAATGWGVLGPEWEETPQLALGKATTACLVSQRIFFLTWVLNIERLVLCTSQ